MSSNVWSGVRMSLTTFPVSSFALVVPVAPGKVPKRLSKLWFSRTRMTMWSIGYEGARTESVADTEEVFGAPLTSATAAAEASPPRRMARAASDTASRFMNRHLRVPVPYTRRNRVPIRRATDFGGPKSGDEHRYYLKQIRPYLPGTVLSASLLISERASVLGLLEARHVVLCHRIAVARIRATVRWRSCLRGVTCID